MKRVSRFFLCAAAFGLFQIATAPNAFAAPILGANLATYAVLGASTVTNTGPTVLNGDLGLSPGTSITGFFGTTANEGPGLVNGVVNQTNAAAATAQGELTDLYLSLAGMGSNFAASADLGGQTLTPGVYTNASSIGLTGTLTLDAEGDADAFWVFQIGSTLTTASASSVVFINGGGDNTPVFWQVGSSATLGTTSAFVGTIAALTSITLTTGATIDCGGAYARNGAVTLDTNTINSPCRNLDVTPGEGDEDDVVEVVPIPEPGTLLLLGTGIVGLVARRRRLARV